MYTTKKKCYNYRKTIIIAFHCDPAGTQTQDLQNRNLTLYSTKLRGLGGSNQPYRMVQCTIKTADADRLFD